MKNGKKNEELEKNEEDLLLEKIETNNKILKKLVNHIYSNDKDNKEPL